MIRQPFRGRSSSLWGERSGLTLPSTLLILASLVVGMVLLRLVVLPDWPVPLSTDEAQYFVWSQNLQAGYYSKPPLIAVAIHFATGLCGPGAIPDPAALPSMEGCVRILQPVATGLTAVLVGLAAGLLSGALAPAVWAAALFATLPLVGFYSLAATTDAWLLLFWSASTVALIMARGGRLQGEPRLGWWLLLGVFVGLGALTKYSMGAFAISVLIVVLRDRLLLTPGPWLAGMAAVLVFLPNVLWNVQNDFPTLQHHVEILQGVDRSLKGLPAAGAFFGAQWLIFGPFLMALLLVSIVQRIGAQAQRSAPRLFAAPHEEARSLALTLTWPILLIVLIQAGLSGANANWAAPAAVGLALLGALTWVPAGRTGERQSRWGQLGLYGSIALGLAFGLLVLAAPSLLPRLGLAGDRQTDPLLHLSGPREAAVVLRNAGLDERLLASDRRLLAGLDAYLPEAEVRAFEKQGVVRNHWELTRPFYAPDTPAGAWLLLEFSNHVPTDREAHLADLSRVAKSLPLPLESVLPLEVTHPDVAAQLMLLNHEGRPGTGILGTWISRGAGTQPLPTEPEAKVDSHDPRPQGSAGAGRTD